MITPPPKILSGFFGAQMVDDLDELYIKISKNAFKYNSLISILYLITP